MSTRRRSANRTPWLGSLALVLMLLAHDVLMASVAHAAGMSPLAAGSGPSHHAEAAAPATPDRVPEPEHATNCSTTGDAIPAAGLDPEPISSLSLVPVTERQMVTSLMLGQWSEPLWPPGVRRAWLQVFRI